jgi:hypothetical protein
LILRAAPLNHRGKGALLYVTATVLVYLDAMVHAAGWHRVGTRRGLRSSVAAVATAIRLRLQNDRRFQLTPLDLIVLFMALVVPSLPGTLRLPDMAGALAIAKLLILFYAIEILISRFGGRAVWLRIATASVSWRGSPCGRFMPF